MTEQDFLAAVIANPDDDTPRLVFADWLDEQGQHERAEFIRVQCAIASWKFNESHTFCHHDEEPPCDRCCHCGWCALRRRERELLYDCGPTWSKDISIGLHSTSWRRGFVAAVTCTAEDWLRHGDAISPPIPLPSKPLSSWQPVEEVRLTTVPLLRSVGLLIGLQGDSALYGDEVNSDRRLDDCLTEKLLRLRWPRIRKWVLEPPTPLFDLPEMIRTTHLNPSIR